MSSFPKKIYRTTDGRLGIIWLDGRESVFGSSLLRESCPCAHCRDEWSGKKLVSSSDIPPDIHPLTIQNVGRYAMNIQWSDGHGSGLYTYDYLRQLSS